MVTPVGRVNANSERTRAPISWSAAIGVGGIAVAFIIGFILPLPYRMTIFHPWLTGDWLIDYSSGFVRRGLFGALIGVSNSDANEAFAIVALTQFFLAAMLFTLVGWLFWRTSRSPAWVMLVLSPAFLLFPLLDYEASARKELLGLAALALLAAGFATHRTNLAAVLALPLYGLAVFSHEVNIAIMPAFLFLLLVQRKPADAATRLIIAGYAAIGVVAMLASFAFRGSTELVYDMCARWRIRGIAGCDGALDFLDQSPLEAQEYLFSTLFPAYWWYLVAAGLAVLPLIALRFFQQQWLIAVIIVAAATPLFVIAWDYGRWIYLVTAQLSLIALALARTDRIRPMRVPLVAAIAFIVLWSMNHWEEPLAPGILFRITDAIL